MKIINWFKRKRTLIIACLFTAVVTWLVTLCFTTGNESFSYRYVKYLIERFYVDDINEELLIEGSITGMVDSLGDQHSLYIPSSYGFDRFDSDVTGEFVGIGISIKYTDGNSVVSEVFENSPAETGGIKVNDIIIGADNVDLTGKTTEEVANCIRGKEGTSVDVKVKRAGEIVECKNIIRSEISAPSVKTKEINDDIGYIQVTSFDADTDLEINDMLKKFNNKKSLIIDLRDNPGGRLDVVINAMDLFLDKGVVLITKYKNSEDQIIYSEDGVKWDKNVCVLVNENSASASEIFSAALKEHKRAEIVGTKTFGKGSIQRTFPVPDNAGVNITIGRFYSPNGNVIDKVGVTPDEEVMLPEQYSGVSITEIPFEDDTQLQKAIEILKNNEHR